jgi:perosamine synthetase
MIDNLICNDQDSILSVLRSINTGSMGLVFVVDREKKLCGVLTDGDIRRALLDNVGLDEKVENIISDVFVYGHEGDNYGSLLQKISDQISIIPLVDDNNRVVNFFGYNEKIFHLPVASPDLNGNEFKYLVDAFMSTWISSRGEYINKFESSFSSYSDCKYGIAVSNGTNALHLALVALGIGIGDEVIVPDLTFAATINAVLNANATPVIVDIERDSWCIDPTEIERAITPKTKAIIPVHLYGQPCDMHSIMRIAKTHNLRVIEDCAEAHGATFSGRKVGSFGDIGCFSFYGNKIITTGEGGMCTTNTHELDDKMRILRDHGMSRTKKYWHDVVGFNYRMTNLQAAIGLAQFERIDAIHENRKSYEDSYKKILDKNKYQFQKKLKLRKKVTWLVSVTLKGLDRDKCIKKMKENGIDARPFFVTLSQMDIYKKYCNVQTLHAKEVSEIGINLPTYENLKDIEKVKKIMSQIRDT